MKEIRIEDGATLLDHSMLVYGNSIGDGNVHGHHNLPVLLAGRGGGTPQPGVHRNYGEKPMTNLYLSLLERLGAPMEKLGDSTGRLDLLASL